MRKWPGAEVRGRGARRSYLADGVAIHHVASLLYGESLHPEQVAQLQKKPVRRAAQIAEPERLRLGERRAVAQEYDGARRRLVGEQQVVPEVVRDDGARGVAVHEQRLPGTRVEQRGLVLREILPDVAHEDRPCQLVLELEPGDVRGREAASVARAGEALVHPARLDTERGRGAQGGDGRQGDLPSLGSFGEDGLGRVAYHHTPDTARFGVLRMNAAPGR